MLRLGAWPRSLPDQYPGPEQTILAADLTDVVIDELERGRLYRFQ